MIAIHGHFYQPERANPWSGAIDHQESAAPFHDWNERIAAECYAPNTKAQVLGPDCKVTKLVNNYARISFDFGPTLLAWLKAHAQPTYDAIIAADHAGQARLSGHGPAIAQMYNHSIGPLDYQRDRLTQAIWGIRAFERHFGRKPEGIWLPETAADTPTLETVAGLGIKYTILAPNQARLVRRIGRGPWREVSGGRIDSRLPYLCRLPQNQSISLFFYDGPIAHDVAFGDLLQDGRRFAERLLGAVTGGHGQLVHVAVDGETFGHHHRFGEMALASCLEQLDSTPDAKLTVYAEHLEKHPPTHEVRIHEQSSWSCIHGVERWQADCGCSTGTHPGWNQAWRKPLRSAMNWLRDTVAPAYEQLGRRYFSDPWQARDDYISLILDPSAENTDRFFARHEADGATAVSRPAALKLLEMQHHALLMFSSDGWFFDDISELTSVQVMRHACRAMELYREVTDVDLEPDYVRILAAAPSNIPESGTGAKVYGKLARAGR